MCSPPDSYMVLLTVVDKAWDCRMCVMTTDGSRCVSTQPDTLGDILSFLLTVQNSLLSAPAIHADNQRAWEAQTEFQGRILLKVLC